jgi:hypothetical protein
MDLTEVDWTRRCALELCRLWPALPFLDAMGIAHELWREEVAPLEPEDAAREEMQIYRRLTR